MTKIKEALPLSSQATGIDNSETSKQTVKGVIEQCVNISLNIESHKNLLTITYYKVYFNSDDEVIGGKPEKKIFHIKDIPAVVEYEVDKDGFKIEGTEVQVSEEDLILTRLNAQLGSSIIPLIIDFVNRKENYI